MDVLSPVSAVLGAVLLLAPLGAVQPGATDTTTDEIDPSSQEAGTDAAVEEVIVRTDGSPEPVAERAVDVGAETVWVYDLIDGFAATIPAADEGALERLDGVESVSPSAEVQTLLNNSVEDIRATSAWNHSYTGANVSIAILDTGIERTDPWLADAISACVSTIDGVVLPECSDTHGHGTHVSGIAASRDETYRGVAHGADIAAVRVLHAAGAGTTADVIAGMEWVAENKDTTDPPIRVASLSLGTTSEECGDGTSPVAEAADALVAAGVNVTVAAGNDGHDECTIDGPAAAENVTTVGAVDDRNTPGPSDDTLAEFSSGGPTTDGRLKPEIVAPGVKIWSPFLGPTIANLDGTSMAAPHVAGTVALLAEKEPGMTPAEVKSRLTNSTFEPDAATDLPNNDWGHGLVDVNATLQLGQNTSSSSNTSGSNASEDRRSERDGEDDRRGDNRSSDDRGERNRSSDDRRGDNRSSDDRDRGDERSDRSRRSSSTWPAETLDVETEEDTSALPTWALPSPYLSQAWGT